VGDNRISMEGSLMRHPSEPTERDVEEARTSLKETVLSELLDDMVFSLARSRGATPSAQSAFCAEIRAFLQKTLGECAVCGALGNHGKEYDQFTDNERLSHQVEADAQYGAFLSGGGDE